ncbi:hypothetical protein R84B8_02834 [Treponema sp. R8-4-B8]
MDKFYKREVSLMNPKIFPRTSLDTQIDNPDIKNSIKANPVEKKEHEIVADVVSALRKTGTK